MSTKIYRVTAFSENTQGGNPAGVVLNADQLTEARMREIAKEVGYSETAFVMGSDKADFKVRFFTPVDEVDLCGHATVATFNLLRELGRITLGEYTQETKAGVLKLRVNARDIYMEQNRPDYYEVIQPKEIVGCFESQEVDYISPMPVEVVSTGLKDIILPVKDLETLLTLKPNLDFIHEISLKYDAVGIHAFCIDPIRPSLAYARNFAPRYGIDEESATGTASGALACYLKKHLRGECEDRFVFEQGLSMNRPSKIHVDLKFEDEQIVEVYVGGSAALTLE